MRACIIEVDRGVIVSIFCGGNGSRIIFCNPKLKDDRCPYTAR